MTNLDEGLLRKTAKEGRKATEILEDEVFRACLEAVNKEFQNAFLGDDEEASRLARHDRRGLERFLGKLATIQRKGKQATERLAEIQEMHKQDRKPTDLLNKGIV